MVEGVTRRRSLPGESAQQTGKRDPLGPGPVSESGAPLTITRAG